MTPAQKIVCLWCGFVDFFYILLSRSSVATGQHVYGKPTGRRLMSQGPSMWSNGQHNNNSNYSKCNLLCLCIRSPELHLIDIYVMLHIRLLYTLFYNNNTWPRLMPDLIIK